MKYFGTDGIRGIAGDDFNADLVIMTGKALSAYLNNECKLKGNISVVIGRDTRASCDFAAGILGGILAAGGITVTELGILPTGALGFLTRELGASIGIMITASHNEARYNGIKLFASDGSKLGNKEIEDIEKLIESPSGSQKCEIRRIKQNFKAVKLWEEHLFKTYVETLGNSVSHDLKIAVDCANGSGAKVAKNFFNTVGMRAVFYATGKGGDDINFECGATHTEFLTSRMKKHGNFDIGFAFDGDADRCVVFDENGETVHGDVVLFLLAKACSVNTLVSTVMFNSGVEEVMSENGIDLVRTKVGDRFIQAELLNHKSAIGGESSGHVLFPTISPSGDGLLTALMLVSLLAKSGKKLSELCSGVEIWPSVMKNVPVTAEQKKNFTGSKEFYKDGCRVLVRASGTENLVRVFTEGRSKSQCDRICDTIICKFNQM